MQKNKFKIHINDFLLFRKSTDEIKRIVKEISKIILAKEVDDFLDIGSGSGELTTEISKKFKIKRTVGIDRETFGDKQNKNIVFFEKRMDERQFFKKV